MKNLIGTISIILLFIGCQSNSNERTGMLRYDIAEKQDVSYLNTPRMSYRIGLKVATLPTEEEMKNTAIHIWKDGNRHWKEFTVFMFMPESGLLPYGVGEFNQKGLVKFNINKNALYRTKWEIKETEEPVKEIPVAELKEYSIALSTINEGKRKIKIIINTNFPDGTNLFVNVGRIHYLKGIKDAYSGDIYKKDLSVEHGKIEVTVDINDSGWYNEHLKLVKALPDDIQPIEKISDNIEIDVMFSPMRTQSDNILQILGTKGEFITGEGAEKFGKSTVFHFTKELNIPFKK